jgi:8-oxo-dGTP diphosphatase
MSRDGSIVVGNDLIGETGPMPSGQADQHLIVAAMLLRADTVLLCHRSADREWYPDVWDLPGGHAEANETAPGALVREVREELGVTLTGSLGRPTFFRTTEEFDLRVWTSRAWSGSPVNCAPREHDEIGWFSEAEALSLRLADDAYRDWIVRALSSQ